MTTIPPTQRSAPTMLRIALFASALLYLGTAVFLLIFGQIATNELYDPRFGLPGIIAAIPLLLIGVLTVYTAFTHPTKRVWAWIVAALEVSIVVAVSGMIIAGVGGGAWSTALPFIGGGVLVGVLAAVKIISLRRTAAHRADA